LPSSILFTYTTLFRSSKVLKNLCCVFLKFKKMRQLFLLIYIFFRICFLYAQQPADSLQLPSLDSISPQELGEIIIIGKPAAQTLIKDKALGSLDSYLEKSKPVNMITRGAYAWEP